MTAGHARRWPYVVLVLVLLLAGAAVVADRIAVGIAESRVADKLTDRRPFIGRPTVRIHGFPFLTQAVGGNYRNIEVSGDAGKVGRFSSASVDADLHGVHLPIRAALNGVDEVPVDKAEVRVNVALSVLAAATGVPGLTMTATGSSITLHAPVVLPVLGTETVTATGTVGVTDGALSVAASAVNVAGVALPTAAAEAAVRLLELHLPLSDYPFDSRIESVRVQGQSIVIVGSATNIVLR
jgi:hypothetical protein